MIVRQKIIKYSIENNVFAMFLWGLQMHTKMYFMGFNIWQFGFGKFLQICLKEFVQTLFVNT